MPTVVGVKLRLATKVLYFDPAGTTPDTSDHVVVETERGTEIGQVVEAPHEVASADLPAALKPVVRVADEADLATAAELREREDEAMPIFRELIAKHGLDMKPIDVEYLFDGAKVIFYFSAEERVDFRELVREMAGRVKARVDMRQVGVRDEARMVGGLGHCGQMLCCVRFPGEFQPVSIRMAKEQDLPLNPLKISGLCGRLMCCLRYEYDAYKDYKSRAPKRGAIIETPIGAGKVVDLNTPRETVTMRTQEGTTLTVPLSAMECGSGKGCPCVVRQEALEAAGVALPASIAAPAQRETAEEKPARDRGRGRQSDRPGRRPEKSGQKAAPKPVDKPTEGKSERKTEGRTQPKGESEGAAQPKPAARRRRRRRKPSGGEATQDG
ncbi:MAG: stage 0 sporulation family protein [Actinomycetota bacterium]|nr:stage 0 sporulation family protein [Actinomycetota bacterium]